MDDARATIIILHDDDTTNAMTVRHRLAAAAARSLPSSPPLGCGGPTHPIRSNPPPLFSPRAGVLLEAERGDDPPPRPRALASSASGESEGRSSAENDMTLRRRRPISGSRPRLAGFATSRGSPTATATATRDARAPLCSSDPHNNQPPAIAS
ncbi:hypothetical protein ACHAWF_015140 [Thalassiosira exigua]